jgi:hypothetical protein
MSRVLCETWEFVKRAAKDLAEIQQSATLTHQPVIDINICPHASLPMCKYFIFMCIR